MAGLAVCRPCSLLPTVLSFKTDCVNSVFAANALGKSSCFEALSFAVKGIVPKLERLPASENAGNYYANRFHGTGVSTVGLLLEADDGTGDVEIKVTRDSSGKRKVVSPSGFPNPEALLRVLDAELALLDHDQFMDFVNDTPLKRGRTFSGLLGLAPLSEFRQALEILSNRRNINNDFDLDALRRLKAREEQDATETETKLRTAFRAFFSKEPDPILDLGALGDSVLSALKEIPVIAPAIKSSLFSDLDFEVIRGAIRKAEASDKRERLAKTLRNITVLEGLGPASSEAGERTELRDALDTRAAALSATRGSLFRESLLDCAKAVRTESLDQPSSMPCV